MYNAHTVHHCCYIRVRVIVIVCVYLFQREKLEDIKRIRAELRERGVELPPLKPDSEHFDSNCITPVSVTLYS